MRLLYWGKDGGEKSHVWGFWLVEWKRLFSIALLKFVGDSREAFHTHAFNSVSWVLKGKLLESRHADSFTVVHTPSLSPVFTGRKTFHRVDSEGTTWVLTLRGPWADTWSEWIPAEKRHVTLTHGRREV